MFLKVNACAKEVNPQSMSLSYPLLHYPVPEAVIVIIVLMYL